MDERMNIALIYSPNWKSFIPIELFAIFHNNPAPIKVYLISDADGYFDYSPIVAHFGEGYLIEFINGEPIYNKKIPNKINVDSRFTKYTLYRLILPEIIHDDKLFYIDTDTIVTGHINDLYHLDMKDHYIMGAEDIGADQYNLKKALGLKPGDLYINAGVMIMNLKKIREHHVQDKWIQEANNTYYAAHDQCIINKTCRGKIIQMNNSYNCSVSTGFTASKNTIKIAHFAGSIKPWQSGGVPNARLWFDAVRNYKKVFGGAAIG